MAEVHRLHVVRRMRIVSPPTLHQQLAGIVSDIEELSSHPDPRDVRSIAARLAGIADRLEEGRSA